MAPFYAQNLYACLNMGAQLTAPSYNLMPIHETVTYPRITVTAENDPCSNRRAVRGKLLVGNDFFEGMEDDDDDDDDAQEREDEDEARTNTELLPTISAPTNSKPPQTNHSSPISLGEEGHLYLAYTRHAGLNHHVASHAAQNRENTPTISSPQRWSKRRMGYEGDGADCGYGVGRGGGRGTGRGEGDKGTRKRRKLTSSV
ncbi:hypothetical protein DDE82_001936 [Stemphylium lycopersici]|nr:hypothetical protein DDE82_001936 [Stemphylium lycopersici]